MNSATNRRRITLTKPASSKKDRAGVDPRTAQILKSLKDARKAAVKAAKFHGVPIVYMKDGKLVRERA